MHNSPVHIGEAVVTTLVPECATLVIDAEPMRQRGAEVVNGHPLADYSVAELVGLTVDQARSVSFVSVSNRPVTRVE